MLHNDLPSCAYSLFESTYTFVRYCQRENTDWREDAISAIRSEGEKGQDLVSRRRVELADVTGIDLAEDTAEISRSAAADVLKLIAFGSLLHGPQKDRRDERVASECVASMLLPFADRGTFLTNHGEAEEGAEADFFATSFHVNGLSSATLDVGLIAFSPSAIIVAWRFEDD